MSFHGLHLSVKEMSAVVKFVSYDIQVQG